MGEPEALVATVEHDSPSVPLRGEGIGGEGRVGGGLGGFRHQGLGNGAAAVKYFKQGAISHPSVAGRVSHVHMPLRAETQAAKHSRWEAVGIGEVDD